MKYQYNKYNDYNDYNDYNKYNDYNPNPIGLKIWIVLEYLYPCNNIITL
jgi:hypothetical protein